MAKLAETRASEFIKMVLVGDSGAGKTTALKSLVAAGYKLRILDMDNGVDSLRQFVLKETPEKADNVDVETLRDKYKLGNIYQAGKIVGKGPTTPAPNAYVKAVDLLSKWPDGTIPAEWGPEYILVIDSLTSLGKAAFEWARAMNPEAKDGRNWYGTAQASIENLLYMMTSEEFRTHLIVISHVQYVEEGADSKGEGGITKGYINAIGKALGPMIPRLFNTLIMATTSGQGAAVRREIRTLPTGIIDLKTPVPFKLNGPLPLGTGLNDLFNLIKEK